MNTHFFILTEMDFSGMPQKHKGIFCVNNLVELDFSVEFAALDIDVTVD